MNGGALRHAWKGFLSLFSVFLIGILVGPLNGIPPVFSGILAVILTGILVAILTAIRILADPVSPAGGEKEEPMPELKMMDRQATVAIAASITWHENGAVLKDGFMDGDVCYFLFEPLTGGVVFAEDKRFEDGLQRFTSLLGTVAYRFGVDGATLPEPLHRFEPADSVNGRFMKYMVHEVTLEGGHANFHEPE